MRVLVCGGRDYRNVSAVRHSLDTLHAKRGITLIIEGGQTGADQLAREWAQRRGIAVLTVEADWSIGKRAGPLRNQRMLDEGKPDGAVAFPGNRGTADMIRRAQAAGLKVWKTGGWPA